MSDWETFAWGFFGAAVMGATIHLLPALVFAARVGVPNEHWTTRRSLLMLTIIVLIGCGGGGVALMFGPSTRGGAIGIGAIADAILKGLFATGAEYTKTREDSD